MYRIIYILLGSGTLALSLFGSALQLTPGWVLPLLLGITMPECGEEEDVSNTQKICGFCKEAFMFVVRYVYNSCKQVKRPT